MTPIDFIQNPDYLPPKAGEPPLHRAARTGDHAAIRRLIEGGADVDQLFDLALDPSVGPMPASPLMVAAGSRDGAGAETMQLLLDLGADASLAPVGLSLARYAASGLGWNYGPGGDAARLRLCLELGGDPNEVDGRGVSLLADAAETGDMSRVELLLGAGAHPDGDQSSMPSRFARDPYVPHDEDAPWGFRIPLHNAAEVDEIEMVRSLLAAGADAHALDNSRRTALFQARSLPVVRILLDAGLDIEAADCFGWSPLVSAVMDGSRDAVNALIAAGADVNATHDRGFTVFMSAVCSSERSLDIIDALVDAGADPLARSDLGWNAFHAAIEVGGPDANSEESIRSTYARIKELGVDINGEDARGGRPVDRARNFATELEVRVLLELGARP